MDKKLRELFIKMGGGDIEGADQDLYQLQP